MEEDVEGVKVTTKTFDNKKDFHDFLDKLKENNKDAKVMHCKKNEIGEPRGKK